MLVDVQLSPTAYDWPALRDLTLAAQEAGFNTAWVFDHLSASSLGGSRGRVGMFECFTLAGALAAATTTIGIGTLVANVANRPIGVLATAAATVQQLSGGRFILGLGAGAAPGTRWSAEHDALHIPLRATIAERHAQVADALDFFDELWRDDPQTRDARFAGMLNPRPRPPVILGVNSDPLAELAGRRADGVNVISTHKRAGELLALAGAAHSDSDRHRHWDVSTHAFWDDALLDPDHPDRRRWSSWGVTRLILVALEPVPPGAIERAARYLRSAPS